MYLLDEFEASKKLSELGHDLLPREFTLEYFTISLLRYPNRLLKVSLLDQSLFAGTGNYITNEICAHGRTLPHRKVSTLKDLELKRLYQGISLVLNPTIDAGGTTFAGGYRDTTGSVGQGVQHLVVFYQKICQLCKKEKVIKTILAQRGTYHCPRCQK